MSFAFYDQKVVTVSFGDPGGDDVQLLLYKAPEAMQVVSAVLQASTAHAAGTAGEFALHNYGTGGTAVEGTVAVAIGGTAEATRIAANTPEAWTISDATLEVGEYLYLDYQETGDYPGGLTSVVLTLRPGKASA